MRQRLARWFRAAAEWLDPTPPPVASPPLAPLIADAVVLVRHQQANWPERSGEAKRHQVLSQLMDKWPQETGRRLARAIEDALDVT